MRFPEKGKGVSLKSGKVKQSFTESFSYCAHQEKGPPSMYYMLDYREAKLRASLEKGKCFPENQGK